MYELIFQRWIKNKLQGEELLWGQEYRQQSSRGETFVTVSFFKRHTNQLQLLLQLMFNTTSNFLVLAIVLLFLPLFKRVFWTKVTRICQPRRVMYVFMHDNYLARRKFSLKPPITTSYSIGKSGIRRELLRQKLELLKKGPPSQKLGSLKNNRNYFQRIMQIPFLSFFVTYYTCLSFQRVVNQQEILIPLWKQIYAYL
eukprot:TRINITY_DN1598_c0_g1_i6.p2 TRINITY_DN1598_c0_g1~~TRINITY_DN1598_c0_g1_i6.p2  ORF type:complete len:198 (+),score=-7.17 TRINITY_DN1598_c0_g1_i6:962-1555(+)